MKKLLFILPLLLIIGCEEEEEESFFVDAWLECENVSIKDTDAEGNIIQDTHYEWSGNSAVIYIDGEAMRYLEFNDYGILTHREDYYDGSKTYYNIFDKWKVLNITNTDSLGDTLSYVEYSWDELTQESESIISNEVIIYTVKYNDYGRQLENYVINTNSSDTLYITTYDYKEDGRRKNNRQFKNNWHTGHTEYVWDINSFEKQIYVDGQLNTKVVGEINEYYKETWKDTYHFIDDSWVFISTAVFEWRCPGFYTIN
jgi:hypothetical protein